MDESELMIQDRHDERQARIADLESRLQEAEAERDRLAAELLANQAREAALYKALRIMAEDRGFNYPQSAAMDFAQEVLASPSPAAEAIGKLIEAVGTLLERNREVGRTIFPRTEPWAAMWAAMNDLEIRFAALQALRSGQPSRGKG